MYNNHYDRFNPSTQGRPCPYLNRRKCPGSHEGCTFWRVQEVEKDGKLAVIANCLFVLSFELQAQNVVESIRTQAAINQFSSQVYHTAYTLQHGKELPRIGHSIEAPNPV